ncbi:hypothetical protein MOQ72_25865 [Saccharopolyspora sp. K220]|uniref:hypothetical protein n=1 Tax=Saccharopolyspora soli TaxID=2926618 RepID=UPI001F56F980|nr:hypothetical protein [Saccharopolyspora soli]MCI2420880.1 hypothetical protein [Saccharopolyspora soli]
MISVEDSPAHHITQVADERSSRPVVPAESSAHPVINRGRSPALTSQDHLSAAAVLDRTLIWNQRHLIQALREFETFYNGHCPQQGIANTRPLNPLPTPITDPDKIARLDIRRHDRLGGIHHEYKHAA